MAELKAGSTVVQMAVRLVQTWAEKRADLRAGMWDLRKVGKWVGTSAGMRDAMWAVLWVVKMVVWWAMMKAGMKVGMKAAR